MSSFISKDTKTLADFDLAVGHESFEDGGQAEHTPKSRHVIGKLKSETEKNQFSSQHSNHHS